MKLQVVFDNDAINSELAAGHGFSCLVAGTLLFDTGADSKSLLVNLNALDGLNNIQSVVISHNHWDHTGGLRALAMQQPIRVYGCPGFSSGFVKNLNNTQSHLKTVKPFQEILPNIYTTGEIPCRYKLLPMPEQALILRTENGLSILCGCAHPGIIRMLNLIANQFPDEPLYAVMGGFHLRNHSETDIRMIIQQFRVMGIQKAGPSHCSGKPALRLFQKEFQADFISLRVGQMLDI